MDDHFLPFVDDPAQLVRHCRMDVHVGSGRVVGISDGEELEAEIVVPAYGHCVIMLRGQRRFLPSTGWGGDQSLRFEGESAEGPFRMTCAHFSVHAASDGTASDDGWVVATPVNEPMIMEYGPDRPATRVLAHINNFDFEYGDAQSHRSDLAHVLHVDAGGRTVEFVGREGYQQLKSLVQVGVLPYTSLNTFSFEVWEGATDSELLAFAHNVAGLCSYVVQQHTWAPVVSWLDGEHRIIKRHVGNTVVSRFRDENTFDLVPDGIPRLFKECFHAHVKMQQSSLPWHKLPAYCASIQDSPYLEQKFASLTMALEFFMKNSWLESPDKPASAEAEKKRLSDMIHIVRGRLRWDIPKHYTADDLIRLLRNAVMHGGELPVNDTAHFRELFDKWRLFLTRRVLIRLGYTGEVHSPAQGCASRSSVADFTEGANSFHVPESAQHAFEQFRKVVQRFRLSEGG